MTDMPKVVRLSNMPLTVSQAAHVFGSPQRLELIRFFHQNPDVAHAEAVASLQMAPSGVSANIRVLVDAGVLVKRPISEHRHTYSVDVRRRDALLEALRAYMHDDYAGPDHPDSPGA